MTLLSSSLRYVPKPRQASPQTDNFAKANLDEFIKSNSKVPPKESSVQNPVTYSSVYLRVQPFVTSLTLPQPVKASEEPTQAPERSNLQFLLHLSDPGHELVHTTITQAVPESWLRIWDDYDWVEDLVAESLRVGIEVIGQDYIVARMGWDKKAVEPTAAEEAPSESAP